MNVRRRVEILVVGMLALLVLASAANAATCRVRTAADGCTCTTGCDGSNWTDKCYTDLQTALANSSCTDIWVASGTYYPDEGSGQMDNDRDSTFDIGGTAGPKLYGGFIDCDTPANCDNILDRKYACASGSNAGRPCGSGADCPGGLCECMVCVGGTDDGNLCDEGATVCSSGGGTCTNFCTILSGDLAQDDTGACTSDTDCDPGNYYCNPSSFKCECMTNADCGPVGTCDGNGNCECNIAQDCAPDGTCTGGICTCWPSAHCRFETPRCAGGSCLKGDNSYHVVSCHHISGTPILDGFVIERGMADGEGPTGSPAALDDQGSAIQIRASTKYCQNNTTKVWTTTCTGEGQGSCNSGWSCNFFPCFSGALDVDNCMVRYNYASNHGAVNDHFAESTFDNCYFHHNTAVKQGAGLNIDNGNASVTNCLFEDNNVTQVTTGAGGAIWAGIQSATGCPTDPTVTLTSCIFKDNTAHAGGAVWRRGKGITIDDCKFFGNIASGVGNDASFDSQGGAVWIGGATSATTVKNSTFEGNDAVDQGGGLFIIDEDEDATSGPLVDNCIFKQNTTLLSHSNTLGDSNAQGFEFTGGGALWIEDYSDINAKVTVNNCDFERNRATGSVQYGGGLWTENNADITVENCTFRGNHAGAYGGAAWDETSDSTYVQCLFVGNSATSNADPKGGALFLKDTDAEFINCALVSNLAKQGASHGEGGGIFLADSTIIATNTIFWQNEDAGGTDQHAQIFNYPGQMVRYSIWEGYSLFEAGVKTADPKFVRDPQDCDSDGWGDPICKDGGDNPTDCATGTAPCDDYGDLELTSTSPCIDAGSNAPISTHLIDLDLNGDTRQVEDPNTVDDGDPADSCPFVDIGAYEFQVTNWCCINGDCNEAGGEVCCGNVCDTCICCGSEACISACVCCENVCYAECCDATDCGGGTPFCCGGTCRQFCGF